MKYCREGQFNVGDIIDALYDLRDEDHIQFDFGGLTPSKLTSYRGNYFDVALTFEDCDTYPSPTVAEFREMMIKSIGTETVGYKGGEYIVTRDKPVWVAPDYSKTSGTIITGIHDTGYSYVLETKYVEF